MCLNQLCNKVGLISKIIVTSLRNLKKILKNKYFEFNGKVKQQLSGAAIGTTFAPPYACIFKDQVEAEFLESQVYKPLVWCRYIDNVFFIWIHGQEKLRLILEDLSKCHIISSLPMRQIWKTGSFWI